MTSASQLLATSLAAEALAKASITTLTTGHKAQSALISTIVSDGQDCYTSLAQSSVLRERPHELRLLLIEMLASMYMRLIGLDLILGTGAGESDRSIQSRIQQKLG